MSVLSHRGGRQSSFNLSPDDLAQMRRLWEGMPELSARDIGKQFGVTKNAVIGHAHRKSWRRPNQEPKKPKPPPLHPRRHLWLETKLQAEVVDEIRDRWDAGKSVASIAREFGVSDNGIYAMARRKEWLAQPTRSELAGPKFTMDQRLDALNAKLDSVLAETRPYIEGRKKTEIRVEQVEAAA